MVEGAEIVQQLMRLLEMPADRLVVLGIVAGFRFDPIGELRVQRGTPAFQEAAVRRVADENMMKAQHRLAEKPARVRLDQFRPAERLEPCVQHAPAAAEQRRNGAAREVTADHRRVLEHRALLRTQPLDARGEQRVDRRRHFQRGEIGSYDPAVAVALDRALVDEHADQLADE
jgi:hypothetical protein